MLIRSGNSGYCFIADFKGQLPTLASNVLLKYLCVLVVQTYKENSVSEELKDIVLLYILMLACTFPFESK